MTLYHDTENWKQNVLFWYQYVKYVYYYTDPDVYCTLQCFDICTEHLFSLFFFKYHFLKLIIAKFMPTLQCHLKFYEILNYWCILIHTTRQLVKVNPHNYSFKGFVSNTLAIRNVFQPITKLNVINFLTSLVFHSIEKKITSLTN